MIQSSRVYILGVLGVLGFVILAKLLFGNIMEGWGTSPATMIQLAAGSSYYPYWRTGFQYRYPYYRYMYPYPTYRQSLITRRHWPRPYGVYRYY